MKKLLIFISLVFIVSNLFSQGQKENTQTKQTEELSSDLPYNYPSPDLIDTDSWINSDGIDSLKELEGKVVLVTFWTYTCINCIRALPHIQALYDKYKDDGFVVIGVHTPEFSYEKKKENVIDATKKYELTFPIVQDNDYKTWRNFNNRYWPAQYLIDKNGNIRYSHFGEGQYQETDATVAALLKN